MHRVDQQIIVELISGDGQLVYDEDR